jgi:hypothetical protein
MDKNKPLETKHSKPSKEWTGKHRGVTWSIKKWHTKPMVEYSGCRGDGVRWNYYLYLDLGRLNDDVADKFWLGKKQSRSLKGRSYYPVHKISKLIPFYADCSYYKKTSGYEPEDNSRSIKVGTDYQHYKMFEPADVEQCMRHVKETIDGFLKNFDYKLRCFRCGTHFERNHEIPNSMCEMVGNYCKEKPHIRQIWADAIDKNRITEYSWVA